jgi:hypothetical protein
MCNLSAEGCTVKKEGGQIAPTRKEKGRKPRAGRMSMERSIRFKEMVFWPCRDELELYRGRSDSAGECAAQDGKNGRGQPSSFLVLSQIFTQSSMHENPPPGDSILRPGL